MEEIKVTSTLYVFETLESLPKDILQLVKAAQCARENAYAPYSNFSVGAALLLDNNEIITGSNQENASYPSGLCAERTAVYYAGSQHPKAKILKMAIVAGSNSHITQEPISPCGACRQAISEYEIKQESLIEIYFMGETGRILKSNSLANLLPFSFSKWALQ